jgi:hypothetical protein
MSLVHMDRGRAAPEHVGEQVAVAVRHLGGTVQLENVARRVVAADGAARLQRHAAMPPDREIELDYGLGLREHGIDVAVALAHQSRLGVAARRELAGLLRGVEQRRQFRDVDRDEVGRVFRDVGIGGEHGSDRLADIAHLAARKHRLAVRLQPFDAAFAEIDRRHVGDVLRGPYRDDAGQRARRRCIDRDDGTVRQRRPGDPHVKLVRKRNVAGEAAAPPHQRRVLEPRHRLADILVVRDLGGVDGVGGGFHGWLQV